MKTDSYNSRDPRTTDQWLLKVMAKCFQNSESWDDQATQVNLVDHPCGFGKTSSLIETINQQTDKRFLIVVPTLSEVERILTETECGRFKSPSNEAGTKANDLERLIQSGVSIVTTHKLFNESEYVAIEGGLRDFHIVIDEVPDVIMKSLTISKQAFEKLYLETGYCTVGMDGRIKTTDHGRNELGMLRGVIDDQLANAILTDQLFYAGGSALVSTLSMHLLQRSLSITVLTFMSEGSMFLRYLDRSDVTFNRYINVDAHKEFRQIARELVTVETITAMEHVSFNYNKQSKYRVGNTEAKSVSNALKNLKQRHLIDVSEANILITCAKNQWYDKNGKPAAFSKGSRMFNRTNWIPNTTRGTNRYDNCSHLIYLYDQFANPAILRWLGASDKHFQDQYALAELIQWVWRSRVRRGLPITLYLPSARMRHILLNWLYES